MTKRSRVFRDTLTHAYKSMSAHHYSRKLFFWLAGLALTTGSLTLMQAGHTKANSGANGALGASVRVSTTKPDDKSLGESKAEVTLETSQTSNSNNSTSSASTHNIVTVNGHPMTLPTNGSVHKNVPNSDGSSSEVDINVNNNGQGSTTNQNSSSSNISIFSQSNSVNSEMDNQ